MQQGKDLFIKQAGILSQHYNIGAVCHAKICAVLLQNMGNSEAASLHTLLHIEMYNYPIQPVTFIALKMK